MFHGVLIAHLATAIDNDIIFRSQNVLAKKTVSWEDCKQPLGCTSQETLKKSSLLTVIFFYNTYHHYCHVFNHIQYCCRGIRSTIGVNYWIPLSQSLFYFLSHTISFTCCLIPCFFFVLRQQ